jgi:Secretion system C-terminal sorting domain/CUB domain
MRRITISIFFFYLLACSLFAQYQSMPAGTLSSSITACNDTFTDSNPNANYNANQNSTLIICPSIPGQYVSVTFVSFSTEATRDFLRIYNGSGLGATIIGTYSGVTSPGTVTSSSGDGCLRFRFRSDGSNQFAGWKAVISCVATPGALPTSVVTDCGVTTGTSICNDASFAGNSAGAGNNDFAFSPNSVRGCLAGGEHQSSWYYFSPVSAGILEFTITPNVATDDYDFAVWGPTSTLQCPGLNNAAPIRCSYSGTRGNTGLRDTASDFSEGSGGDKYVKSLTVVPGEYYTMLIDNFTASSFPFVFDWTFIGGASLNCAVLPIELLYFKGSLLDDKVVVSWATASEKNNDRFEIERSSDGDHWKKIATIRGNGNTSSELKYSVEDVAPLYGVSYYRLKQIDYNGKSVVFDNIVIENSKARSIVAFPNPSNNEALKLQIRGFKNQDIQIELKSLVGEIILSRNIKSEMDNWQYDLSSNAAEGTYLLSIKSNNYVSVKKVIIQ